MDPNRIVRRSFQGRAVVEPAEGERLYLEEGRVVMRLLRTFNASGEPVWVVVPGSDGGGEG